jgi:hypothetical protein
MSDRRTDTIKIGGGVEYAKVAARLMEFHDDNTECSIVTTCDFKDGWALFCATVTNKRGTFTGHSLGKVGSQKKDFEKQETIAVGRALAFAGYLASGEIASVEEMAAAGNLTSLVKLEQINDLKRQWALQADLDGKSKAKMADEFSAWVSEVTDNQHLDVSDFRQWTAEDLTACINALQEAEA